MPALIVVLSNVRSRLTRGRIVSRVFSLEILDRGREDTINQFLGNWQENTIYIDCPASLNVTPAMILPTASL